MTELSHNISTKGRFYLSATEAPGPQHLLVGFHGYGSDGPTMLGHLDRLALGDSWLKCSIQALHPFYLNKNNDVGFCWLTRHHWQRAAAVNVSYVQGVLKKVLADYPTITRHHFLGFSQGANMAFRAAALTTPKASSVIAIGGGPTRELTHDQLAALPPTLHCRGHQDRIYTEERLKNDRERLQQATTPGELLIYKGRHGWSKELVEKVSLWLHHTETTGKKVTVHKNSP